MNKRELISRYAQKRGVNRERATEEIVCILETIAEGLMVDEEVVISNFGIFEVSAPQTRSYKLPTGGTVEARPEGKVRFRPSRNLINFVNGDKKPIGVNK